MCLSYLICIFLDQFLYIPGCHVFHVTADNRIDKRCISVSLRMELFHVLPNYGRSPGVKKQAPLFVSFPVDSDFDIFVIDANIPDSQRYELIHARTVAMPLSQVFE